jgi:hypothetical protein
MGYQMNLNKTRSGNRIHYSLLIKENVNLIFSIESRGH